MGRTLLSVKLAVGFAVVVLLAAAATQHVRVVDEQRRTPLRAEDGLQKPSDLACDPVADMVFTAAFGHEQLDSLPLWRGTERQDCPARTTVVEAAQDARA